MKILSPRSAVLLLSISLFAQLTILPLYATGDSGSEKTLSVGTEGTYKPYSYHDNSGKLTGYDVEVIQALGEELGFKIKFVESRWDGLLAGLQAKRWDIVANQVWWNESRAQEYSLSKSYMLAGASVLVRKDSSVQSYKELKGRKAAVSLTSSFRPYVEDLTQDIEFQDDFLLAVDLLKNSRVDFVVNDTQSIGWYLRETPQSKLKGLSLDSAEKAKVVLAMNKEDTDLLEQINQALATLEQNGTLDRLNQQYFAGLK